MLKISIYALHLGFGGVENFVISLANILSEKYDVTIVVTYKVNSSPAFRINDSVKVVYLIDDYPRRKEFIKSLKSFSFFKVLSAGVKSIKLLILKKTQNVKYIKRDRSDVQITTRIFHNKLVNNFGNEKSIKIATEHNHPFDLKYEKKLLRSINNFDAFIPISKYLRDYYEKKVPDKVYIQNIPFYVDVSHDTKKIKKSGFVFVGRLEPEKQVLDAIKFIEEIAGDNILHICGDGSQRELAEKYVVEHNLQNNVKFLGFLDKDDLMKIVGSSEFMLITSTRESFGIAAIESMILRTIPLVYPSAQGVVDILEDHADLVCEKGTVKSLRLTYNYVKRLDRDNLLNRLEESARLYDIMTMRNDYFSLIAYLEGKK